MAKSGPYLFIPLIVKNIDGYSSPPASFREYVQRRLYYDRDPTNGYDRSRCPYLADSSHGRASLNARARDPVTVNGMPAMGMTPAAIKAQPNAHLYSFIAVVCLSKSRGAGQGMAQPGQIEFDPPRQPNRTKARSRFLRDDPEHALRGVDPAIIPEEAT